MFKVAVYKTVTNQTCSNVWKRDLGLRKAQQDMLEITEMRMLRWITGIKWVEKIGTEEIRTRAGVANISEKIREARLRWLGHVERKTEEDIVIRTWKMGLSGHRKKMEVDTERPKLKDIKIITLFIQ